MSEIDYDLLALSHPQKRIWYSEQLQPGTGMWNNAGTVKIFGEIDFNLLEQAVNIVIEKCESLRTRISDSKDVTLQYIQPFEYAKLELIDFSNKTTEEVYQWDREQSVVATKFVDSNLFYFAMLKLEHNQAGLYIRINHLISDAWSIVLLINHITETYDNLLLGDHLPISEFRPYTDYIDAEQAYLNSKRSQNDSNYWKEKYSVIPEFLSLKTKYDNVRENAAERKTYVTSGDIAKDVKEYCKTNRVSVFSFMVSLLGIYLHRITGKTDFVIGTSILNRVNEDEKNTFGMFVSTVPLRVTIDPEMPFREFHQSQATEIISSLRHQKYPYNLLMEEIRKNNRGVDSLFEITLSFQNASLAKDTTGFQYEVRWHSPLAQTNSLDIHLNDREGDDIFVWDYNYLTSLFSDSDIDLMQDYLANLLLEVLADPDIAVKDIKLMSEAQQQQLLQDMRGEQGKRQAAATLIEQFEDRVRRNPDAVTLITEQTQYTARQLDEKANGVAAYLMPLGAKVDQPIIVMMNKGHALISSILGILKSSAAFLPLAPETPAERVKVICRRCKARIAIVDKEYAEYFPKNVKVITSDEIKEIAPQPQALTTTHSPTSLAYIIFTSGTTGEPKGVMIENHSVARFVENYSDIMDMSEGITTLAVDSISFDIFIIEIFPALVGGAVLVLATDEESKLPDEIAKLVLDNNGNSFMCTPSRMSMLLSQCPPDTFYDIRQIMLGGEALSASLVKRFRELSKGRIYNFYGPTETTIGVTFKEITDEEINIGRPMQDVSAYILSDNLMLAPRGSTGELYIAGDCLARGYIGNQAETDRVFLPDPFNPGKRMYKTGDVVSLSDNNEIIYIGRSDSQVKIRGFRIELDEIQTRLFQIEGIDDCVVIDLENENKEKYLVAYICGDNTPTRSEIRTILGQSLPYYMVPAYFVRLPEIPLTTNGKLNRRALPEPDRQNEDIVITDRTVAPRTKTEILLADLWSHALGVKVNDRNDNFFELGGNSLNIIAVAAAVRSYFDLEVSLKEVYADPTLKAYAALIDKAVAGDEYIPIAKTELQRDYPASAAQRRVFMLRGIDDESIVYNMPGALRIQGKLDLKRLKAAYRTIVARHESLRTGIFMRGGELRQKVHAKVAVDIMSHSATHKQLPTMLKGFIQPFDISRPPLMRIEHVALSDDEHVLFIDMHHIISDGISYELVVSQLTDAYEGRALPEEKLRYTDYAVWQADFFTTLSMQRQKDYWQQQLGGELPQLSLRTDVPRHSHQQFIGKRSSFRITRRMQNDIHRFARSKALTPYTVMLSAFYIMLARYTSDEDIIIGTPSAGRNREELTDIVGMFVNTLALRTRPEGTKSCSDFMKEVQSTV
ncbi:MAG: amino acid adenylation domain-containing protein, partial [Oscillospiraceae bacterium]|nr:amino acid adenylation domain-containing protein [Oscillospiraceae bacterium]